MNKTLVTTFFVIIIVLAIFLFMHESYKHDLVTFPTDDDQPKKKNIFTRPMNLPYYENDNAFYQTGGFFLPENSTGYKIYNAYKMDPSKQPISLPPVDYQHSFVSPNLPSYNPMFAIPSKTDEYINLLNKC